MSTDLTVVNNGGGAVANYNPMVETGLDEVTRLRPTNLTLIQPVTRETHGANPGQFLDVLTEEAHNEVTVVPLRIQKQRALFPPVDSGEKDPVCRSNDGVSPSPFAKQPQAAQCATCPMAQWGKDAKGRPIKPKCAEKLRLLVIMKDSGLPRFFTVGGMGIKSLKHVLDRIRQDIHMSTQKGDPRALYDYYFTLSSEKVINTKGVYYLPRFDNVKKVANASEFGPLFEQFVVNAKAQEDEEEAVAANEAQADGAVGQVLEAQEV